jgi:hypothetical protein
MSATASDVGHGDPYAGAAGASLDKGTQLGDWLIRSYPGAAEAVVVKRTDPAPPKPERANLAEHFAEEYERAYGHLDEERRAANRKRSASRARSRVRRYCKANRLGFLWTLTLAEQTADAQEVKALLALFFRLLREHRGGNFPYVWVIERHKSGKVHVHFAINFYVPHRLMQAMWGKGYVFVSSGPKSKKSGARRNAGNVASYLAKYVGKTFDEIDDQGDEESGRKVHRYDVAQHFQPERIDAEAATLEEAMAKALATMTTRPTFVWDSQGCDDWDGPPCRVLFFDDEQEQDP